MSKLVRKIAMLFMVCGLAVSVSSGAKIYEDEQEKIDEVMAQYKKTLKACGMERPTIEKCNDESDKDFYYRFGSSSAICKAERFFNFVEFYKSYGGEFDGHEAFMKAKRDKNSETKYGILGGANFGNFLYATHKRLIYSLKETAIKGY